MLISSRVLVFGIAIGLLVGCTKVGAGANGGQTLTGPYTCDNLSVFFIRGEGVTSTGDLLTLEEALESGKIEVIETGSVGELAVENLCNHPVFIQAGDIVKGGRQDRVLRYDIVVKPGSGRIPVESFCVEQGRWSARGNESVANFESSGKALNSKGLKIAARLAASQTEVWSQVAEVQEDMRNAFGEELQASESPTSLQLTLENDKVKTRVADCVDDLTAALDDIDDAIGFAFAINGEINSADIYGSPRLFAKMWPKLIEAAATEAAASPDDAPPHTALTADEVQTWLVASDSGSISSQELGDQLHLRTTESKDNVAFETGYHDSTKGMLHKNVIKK